MGEDSTQDDCDPDEYFESPEAYRLLARAARQQRRSRPARSSRPSAGAGAVGEPSAAGLRTPDLRDLALACNIRLRRDALGMTRSAMAKNIGVSQPVYEDYEHGYKPISFSQLVNIADICDCRIGDLIGEIDDGRDQTSFRQDTRYLRIAGAAQLLGAYSAAPPALRKAILRLVVALANERRERLSRPADPDVHAW